MNTIPHDELQVFLNDRKIGILNQDNGVLSFAYDEDYRNASDAYPLAQNMPLSAETFHEPEVENFFSNLLPDERMRDAVARILGTSRDNTFRLLKELGADCAGAVSFYPQGMTPRNVQEPVYRQLSEDEACAILDNLGERPLDAGDQGVRISGAGSQEKLVACVQEDKISLPLYGTPSTHIIKPGIIGLEGSVFNEYFCMKLAQRCKIPAADCDILTLKDEPFYVVTRFDRTKQSGAVTRLHQEDFCQLLNISPKLKYQEDGGPGVEECMQAMIQLRLAAGERLKFIRLVLFNVLIGNCDAHAKNYAILYQNGGIPVFAPAYDLLSTMIYDNMSKRFAMKIGDEMRMGMLRKENFAQMAQQCGIKPQMILRELQELAATLPQTAQTLAAELNQKHPSPVYDRIAWKIKQICLQITNPLI